MAIISMETSGSFDNLKNFLNRIRYGKYYKELVGIAEEGLSRLVAATPEDTGVTAASWDYEIHRNDGQYTITWTNSNINEGVNVAILVDYGHAQPNGGYVYGYHFINSSLTDVYNNVLDRVLKAVNGGR